jgi:hypothetical protein
MDMELMMAPSTPRWSRAILETTVTAIVAATPPVTLGCCIGSGDLVEVRQRRAVHQAQSLLDNQFMPCVEPMRHRDGRIALPATIRLAAAAIHNGVTMLLARLRPYHESDLPTW